MDPRNQPPPLPPHCCCHAPQRRPPRPPRCTPRGVAATPTPLSEPPAATCQRCNERELSSQPAMRLRPHRCVVSTVSFTTRKTQQAGFKESNLCLRFKTNSKPTEKVDFPFSVRCPIPRAAPELEGLGGQGPGNLHGDVGPVSLQRLRQHLVARRSAAVSPHRQHRSNPNSSPPYLSSVPALCRSRSAS